MGNQDRATGTQPSGESRPHRITVVVRVFGDLQVRMGQGTLKVHLEPGTTVECLLRHVLEPLDGQSLDFSGSFPGQPDFTVVILNGSTLNFPGDIEREIKHGDKLLLLPVIDGG